MEQLPEQCQTHSLFSLVLSCSFSVVRLPDPVYGSTFGFDADRLAYSVDFCRQRCPGPFFPFSPPPLSSPFSLWLQRSAPWSHGKPRTIQPLGRAGSAVVVIIVIIIIIIIIM